MAVIFDPAEPRQFSRVISLLKQGIPVGLPTETVYGLGGLALNETALAQIFSLKNRPTFDPLIVHILPQDDWVKPLIRQSTPLHGRLMKAFWPGPLTILFEKSERVPDLCTASTPYVALRAPLHPIFQKVLKELNQPVAAPSANRFGRISPTSAEDVVSELGPFGLEGVLDGGSCQHGLESTVVKVENNGVEILRLGAISLEDIRNALPSDYAISVRSSGTGIDAGVAMQAPGLLKSHYAPNVPLILRQDLKKDDLVWIKDNYSKVAVLNVFGGQVAQEFESSKKPLAIRVLSEEGNDVVAAAKLFRTLRELDALGPAAIFVELAPETRGGLCPAINDRLRRAASNHHVDGKK